MKICHIYSKHEFFCLMDPYIPIFQSDTTHQRRHPIPYAQLYILDFLIWLLYIYLFILFLVVGYVLHVKYVMMFTPWKWRIPLVRRGEALGISGWGHHFKFDVTPPFNNSLTIRCFSPHNDWPHSTCSNFFLCWWSGLSFVDQVQLSTYGQYVIFVQVNNEKRSLFWFIYICSWPTCFFFATAEQSRG